MHPVLCGHSTKPEETQGLFPTDPSAISHRHPKAILLQKVWMLDIRHFAPASRTKLFLLRPSLRRQCRHLWCLSHFKHWNFRDIKLVDDTKDDHLFNRNRVRNTKDSQNKWRRCSGFIEKAHWKYLYRSSLGYFLPLFAVTIHKCITSVYCLTIISLFHFRYHKIEGKFHVWEDLIGKIMETQ